MKRREDAPPDFFATEARGLRWLAATGTVAVPEVRRVDERSITVAWIEPGPGDAAMAERFGRALADLHQAGAPGFGAPWPGFIGPLAMDNRAAEGRPGSWAPFYVERRVLPFLRAARDTGAVDRAGVDTIERALADLEARCGPSAAEPPRRLHGDLWSGNLVWGADGTVWVVDPAAHGGHRETDLAMLALFGAPHLARILAAYDEHRPLADGWRDRVGLHQLHPLLVHAVLFGGSYGGRAVGVARQQGGC